MASLASKIEFAADFDRNGLVRKARDAARDAGKRSIHFVSEFDPALLVAKARAARAAAQMDAAAAGAGLQHHASRESV